MQKWLKTRASGWTVGLALAALLGIWRYVDEAPHTWAAKQIPVAWWAWRRQTPTAAEIKGVTTLFLHAWQIDQTPNGLRRIRPVEGTLPAGPSIHLVYNATRPLLTAFAETSPQALATTLAEAYRQDWQRGQQDCANISGLQLDLDVPARALPQYRQLLLALRQQLPPGTKLSITGLETWLDLPELKPVLAATDFWVPQCYGAQIPQRLNQSLPIASPNQVAALTARARQLGHPFYAGLAAYGYAILYNRTGQLLELRGDLNPSELAAHPDLTLIERRPFTPPLVSWFSHNEEITSEWRYVYRAARDCVIDGLVIRAGESLVLDVPSTASLRSAARAAREQGGRPLLGLCVFRLPSVDDASTLSQAETAAALTGQASTISLATSATFQSQLLVTVTNRGTASSLLGDSALTLNLRILWGSLGGLTEIQGFSRTETLCEDGAAAQPCSWRRANLLRLTAKHLRSGETLQVALTGLSPRLTELPLEIILRTDDGRLWQERRTLQLQPVRTGGESDEK